MFNKGKHWITKEVLLLWIWFMVVVHTSESFTPKSRFVTNRKTLSELKNAASVGGTKSSDISSTGVKRHEYKIVCYYTNWSQYRPKIGRFVPEDIEPDLCTHIIFAFGWLKRGRLSSFEENDESKNGKKGFYEKINELKNKNSKLKTLLAIGGWSFGTEKFKDMSNSRYSRQTFIMDAIPYLRNRNFDGLDLDWEYPKGEDDKKNFVALLKELNQAFTEEAKETKQPKLLLTAAVPAGSDSVRGGYDVPEVAKNLDFINLMSYDYHGKWEKVTGHNSPLYPPANESQWRQQLCMDFSADMWVRLGTPAEKLIIGTGTYGRTFTLTDPRKNGLNAAAKGGGKAGIYTREEGFLAYYEICELLKDTAYYVWDDEMKAPYAYYGDQWIGFDDERSIRTKMHWIKESGYGGAMVWTVDMDDFKNVCGYGAYPLIGLMRAELLGIPRSQGSEITDWSKFNSNKKMIFEEPEEPELKLSTDKLTPELGTKISEVKQQLFDNFDPLAPKIICYYTTWSSKRSAHGKFLPEYLNQTLCTHIVIAFATIKGGRLAPGSETDTEFYASVVDLKKKSPTLKVLLALGGWNFGSKPFREMTETMFKRNNFVYNAVEFLRLHDFDGIDIDWEYPRGTEDKERYSLLLKELKEAFEGESKVNKQRRLILSAAVPANAEVIHEGYDVPEISKYLDMFNVMTYDYHGLWEEQVGHNSPLKAMSSSDNADSQLTVEFSAEEWVKLGAPRERVMIGVAMYGRTFTLSEPKKFDIGSPAVGGGKPGKYTKEPGILAFYEICDFLRDNATLVWDTEQLVPFAYKADQWVGFDDERSIKGKMDWLKEKEFGGVMIWSVDLDDFKGHCGGPSYPLLSMVHKELEGYDVPGVSLDQESSVLYGTAVQSTNKVDEVVCKEADGFISYHVDKEDCTRYYMCEGERRHHMPCPVNLVFNINENVCDWPENVAGCGLQTEKPKSE